MPKCQANGVPTHANLSRPTCPHTALLPWSLAKLLAYFGALVPCQAAHLPVAKLSCLATIPPVELVVQMSSRCGQAQGMANQAHGPRTCFPNSVMLIKLMDVSPHNPRKCSSRFSHPLTHDMVTINHLVIMDLVGLTLTPWECEPLTRLVSNSSLKAPFIKAFHFNFNGNTLLTQDWCSARLPL